MTIRIRLLRLGTAANIIDCDPGATVGDALRQAGIEQAGLDLTLNGLSTGVEPTLVDGDVLVCVPRVKGGLAGR